MDRDPLERLNGGSVSLRFLVQRAGIKRQSQRNFDFRKIICQNQSKIKFLSGPHVFISVFGLYLQYLC